MSEETRIKRERNLLDKIEERDKRIAELEPWDDPDYHPEPTRLTDVGKE